MHPGSRRAGQGAELRRPKVVREHVQGSGLPGCRAPGLGWPGNFPPRGETFPARGRDSKNMDSCPGDDALLAAVAERDMGAFRALCDRHAGRIAIRLARRCNDRHLVADAVQDTFAAVWQRPRDFRLIRIGGGGKGKSADQKETTEEKLMSRKCLPERDGSPHRGKLP